MLATKLPYNLMIAQWSQELNPLLASPLADAVLLSGIPLQAGNNTINHMLGQKLQGYMVVLNSAAATFYDGQNTNPTPTLTLVLNASVATTVSLIVF